MSYAKNVVAFVIPKFHKKSRATHLYRPPIVRFLGLTFGGRYNFQCVSRLFILSGLWLFPAISPDLYSNSHKVFPYRFLPLILPLLLLMMPLKYDIQQYFASDEAVLLLFLWLPQLFLSRFLQDIHKCQL